MFKRSSLKRLITGKNASHSGSSKNLGPSSSGAASGGHSSTLFDEDPGIMSEVETAATGFRRGAKARSSLPIVRTPSKTQDRSLGLVFLQYRNETKRALLPNEITSMDTVKALFVRSFPRQLTMQYLDSRNVRIYAHDPNKDMFYELEDLRDVKDRTVLRIYEQDLTNGSWQPVGGVRPEHPQILHTQPPAYLDNDPSYFSEPEFESDFQNQHIHRGRKERASFGAGSHQQLPSSASQSQYYGTIIMPPAYRAQTMVRTSNGMTLVAGPNGTSHPPQPPERSKQLQGYSQTMPRGMSLATYGQLQAAGSPGKPNVIPQRAVSPDLVSKTPKDQITMTSNQPGAPPKPQRSFTALLGPGVRGPVPGVPQRAVMSPQSPSHGPFGRPLPDRPYSVAGQYPSPDRGRLVQADYSGYMSSPERRVPGTLPSHQAGPMGGSFDDPYDLYGSRPSSVAAVDDLARQRMESMERQIANLTGIVEQVLLPQAGPGPGSATAGRSGPTGADHKDKLSKPAPPPKPATLVGYRGNADGSSSLPSINLTHEMYTQLRQLRCKTKDLRSDCRNLRRLAQQQSMTAKETLKDTCNQIKNSLFFLNSSDPIENKLRIDRLRLSRDEETYRTDVSRLEKDLTDLEGHVEELRSNVINRRCRVNMTDVEGMALVLSRASKTVADLKLRYPLLQETLRSVMQHEMEVVVREEKFLKEEPDKLETALKRCKKLTGTLVTLKRLASVQEQRTSTSNLTHGHLEKAASADCNPELRENTSARTLDHQHTVIQVTPATPTLKTEPRENMLDALLDELQTFSKPLANQPARRSFDASVALAVEKTKKQVPLPPPRSSSRINDQAQQLMLISSLTAAALASATNAARSKPNSNQMALVRSNSEAGHLRPKSTPPEVSGDSKHRLPEQQNSIDSLEGHEVLAGLDGSVHPSTSTTSLSSVDSQGSQNGSRSRHQLLEDRHQELLRKQKLLQEQYSRLQLLSKGQIPKGLLNDLKKTGSESDIMSKSAIGVNNSGSLTQLNQAKQINNQVNHNNNIDGAIKQLPNGTGSTLYTSPPKVHVNGKKAAPAPPTNQISLIEKNCLPSNVNQISSSSSNSSSANNSSSKHVETQKIYETDIL
ncbi:Coiled-coil domain-containing protein [Halotydeus destructor]|nr:Coiled-coil domain-containing protein [Halotydeus destructor]